MYMLFTHDSHSRVLGNVANFALNTRLTVRHISLLAL